MPTHFPAKGRLFVLEMGSWVLAPSMSILHLQVRSHESLVVDSHPVAQAEIVVSAGVGLDCHGVEDREA